MVVSLPGAYFTTSMLTRCYFRSFLSAECGSDSSCTSLASSSIHGPSSQCCPCFATSSIPSNCSSTMWLPCRPIMSRSRRPFTLRIMTRAHKHRLMFRKRMLLLRINFKLDNQSLS
ncbi:hypothetical protein RvY_17317 [Ramazzottius varieornatus]|uniref:Uncharacterized protein n=1 Tax=Ramazzottius varieornatus TaxID=947166 RepID=A0A1D1W1Q7_RAMVA|nr:hypothetical protein RvY_17317 [Ramazzottius varieornatus]